MTPEEILAKAIEKAIEGGWTPPFEEPITNVSISQDDVEGTPQLEPYIKIEFDNETSDYLVGIPGLLYDKEWAKALWGDGWAWFTEGQSGDTLPSGNYINYKGHLANMAVANDPIQYLGENLPS